MQYLVQHYKKKQPVTSADVCACVYGSPFKLVSEALPESQLVSVELSVAFKLCAAGISLQ